MSLGMSQEERDLTTRLAATLVEEQVMRPMVAHGWRHGTPPAPAPGGTTPPAEGAQPATSPAGQPAASGQPATPPAAPNGQTSPGTANGPIDLLAELESVKDANGLYYGKYKTKEEAIKGLGHAVKMAKQAFGERDALREEITALKAAPSQSLPTPPVGTSSQPIAAVSRTAVDAAQAKLDAVLASVVENGGILDEERARNLSVAQRELSSAEAQYALDSRFASQNAEREQWSRADRYMAEKHPDSMKFVDEIGLHIETDPLLREAVGALVAQGKVEQASELAWVSYRNSAQLQTTLATTVTAQARENELAAGEQVRQELVEKARRDAGVITGSAGGQGTHERPTAPNQSQINALADAMRREGMTPGTGAGAAFRDLIIGPSLDPNIFG